MSLLRSRPSSRPPGCTESVAFFFWGGWEGGGGGGVGCILGLYRDTWGYMDWMVLFGDHKGYVGSYGVCIRITGLLPSNHHMEHEMEAAWQKLQGAGQ